VAMRDLVDWQTTLTGLDIAAQRDILAALIERVVPERTGRGQYAVQIEWTPLGSALGKLREALAAA
jgi:hypothetical protein